MNKKYLVIGGVVAALGGVAWYASNQIKLIDKLKYSVTGYDIVSISPNGARVDLKIGIENTGLLKLKVKQLKLNVFAENKFIATAYSDKVMSINPNQTEETSIQILLNPKILIQNLGSILMNTSISTVSGGGIDAWKNINLKIDGSISISKGGIPFWIPIVYGFKLNEFTQG